MEIVPEIVPEVIPEIVPEIVPDSELKSESKHETDSDSKPESTPESKPESTPISKLNSQDLCVLIDTTGSMAQWIDALRHVLTDFMHTVALTGVFDRIGILGYKDYDVTNVTTWSGWMKFSDPKLFKFTKSLQAHGGGDDQEAVHTALIKLVDIIDNNSDNVILHLADACEHMPNTTGKEGLKEKNILGNLFINDNLTDYIARHLIQKNATMRYAKLTTVYSTLSKYLATAYNGQIIQLSVKTPSKDLLAENLTTIFNNWCGVGTVNTYEIKNVVDLLSSAVMRVRTNEQYASYIYECLKNCFNDNILSMCNNEVIGKIWREFCKRRGDQRRAELFNILDRAKNSLTQAQRDKFEKFNRDSYSQTTEIEEQLNDWISKNGIKGVIRYTPDTLLHPQDVLKVCRDCLPENQRQIKEILARVTIDEKFQADSVKSDTLPKNCLPANMPSGMQLSYILHLAAPGISIGGRPQMIVAMLARGTVLDKAATYLLNKKKGTWLNFKNFEDDGPLKGTPVIPENFSSHFLYLLLQHQEFLTEQELSQIKLYINILRCLRLPHYELMAQIPDHGCLDGIYPDHGYMCVKCNKLQPLSLVNSKNICGYCHFGIDAPNEFNPLAQYQVQCDKCSAIYARDKKALIAGKSLCYCCRGGYYGSSPTVKCITCNHKFITYHGLPDNMCASCTNSVHGDMKTQRYVDVVRKANTLFEDHHFLRFYNAVGISASEKMINIGLIRAKDMVTSCTPTVEEYKERPFDNICNRKDLYYQMIELAKGKQVDLPECALCCSQIKLSDINRACGRRGCDQRICNTCGINWYSVLKAGSIILERHALCPFCARKPDAKTIRRWCPGALWLTMQIELNPANYYAWCSRCNKAKEYGNRNCAGILPILNNWICTDCKQPTAQIQVKPCPKCGVMSELYDGCNHMACPCGEHWCFECGVACHTSDATYTHMRSEHGRIYRGNAAVFQDDSDFESDSDNDDN